jgi:hypothetical protein
MVLLNVGNIDIPFGSEYYQALFKVPMITDQSFIETIKKFNTPGSIIEGRTVISFEDAGRMVQNQQIKNSKSSALLILKIITWNQIYKHGVVIDGIYHEITIS